MDHAVQHAFAADRGLAFPGEEGEQFPTSAKGAMAVSSTASYLRLETSLLRQRWNTDGREEP